MSAESVEMLYTLFFFGNSITVYFKSEFGHCCFYFSNHLLICDREIGQPYSYCQNHERPVYATLKTATDTGRKQTAVALTCNITEDISVVFF